MSRLGIPTVESSEPLLAAVKQALWCPS